MNDAGTKENVYYDQHQKSLKQPLFDRSVVTPSHANPSPPLFHISLASPASLPMPYSLQSVF